MFKTILKNTGETIWPTLGGAGLSLSVWWESYSNLVWSAIIFAVVGGVLGFLVGKFMQWIWNKITRESLNK